MFKRKITGAQIRSLELTAKMYYKMLVKYFMDESNKDEKLLSEYRGRLDGACEVLDCSYQITKNNDITIMDTRKKILCIVSSDV